ncbi:hypothetical protein B0A52_09185 [Exophiala mesophila]|uniref:Nuclear speckle splicing regulatory protein 1 N-terminal domain-containing protein n=1 Tax=Exophiala mesophila TaxID=212818 RepID=A0A438MVR4_EXOME|nr:hypothetical protein B0A52_09185 [Exophiala mesophila]
MPALAFGLNAAKTQPRISKPAQKRKAVFDQDDDASESEDAPPPPAYGAKKPSKPLRPLNPFDDDDEDAQKASQSPKKSPKLSLHGNTSNGPASDKYTNLSALRSAKLHDQQASQIDKSVYDYDAAYDTFHVPKQKKVTTDGDSKPKYMTALMESSDVRKRDQLRAREKLLQRERDAEGDEFADKEKFVTQAYKKQQEEVKIMEAEEKKREEEEEERRRKGGGMTAFHKRMLEKDEERMRLIAEAEEAAAQRNARGEDDAADQMEEERSEAKIAQDLNEKGAHIIVNDDGEVVDKRQLLSAGLNTAPKKPSNQQATTKSQESGRPQEYWRSSKAQDARSAQRERQSRMMERQIEEMVEKEKQAQLAEQQQQQDKSKSKVTEADKMGARERFLQRKKEREEEAKRKKETGG